MKTRCGKVLAILGVLLFCLILPVSVSAQSPSELADYVDLEQLDRYLRAEFEDSLQMGGVRTEVDLSEFQIPVELKEELERHIPFTLPEIVVGSGWWLQVENEYVSVLAFFPSAKTAQIRTAADMLMRGVEGNDALTDVQKALVLHDRLALWAEYDYEAASSGESTPAHTVFGTLTNRMAVCQGYALTYQYLLTRAGIYCEVHTSYVMDHAWNAVWLDGESYMVDVTWDDEGGYGGLSEPIKHDCFLRSDGRYQVVDGNVESPNGTKYRGIWWPSSSFIANDRVYCQKESELYLLDGVETQKVVIPGVEYLFVSEAPIGVGDKLIWDGYDFLCALDVTTGESETVWKANGRIDALDYANGRIACLVNETWVYPFADTAYTITFENWDGTVLQTGSYEYGQIWYAPDVEPVRPGYKFIGWEQEKGICQGDTVYTAQFTPCQPDGWTRENGRWAYLVNGYKKTGWYQESGKWYYLNYAGFMQTGLCRYETSNLWHQEYTYYFFDSYGVMQTGWKKLDDIWYYFTPSGKAATLWNEIGGRRYFFDICGEMKTGWFYQDGKQYYLDENVGALTGWKTFSSGIDKVWYYFDADGDRAEGWRYIDGTWYYFDDNGEMQTGWFTDNGKRYYFRDSGAMAVGWQQINNSWYYFDAYGARVTGWKSINGKWYYFWDGDWVRLGQMLQNEAQKIGNHYYRFDQSGAMVTGWTKVGDTWYYYNASGAMVTGWQSINGKWYYFGTDGQMDTSFRKINGVTYYFGEDGAMRTGWIRIPGVIYRLDGTKGDAWCYAESSGAIQFGWKKLGEKWYYFNDFSGYMYTGKHKIGDKWYTFSDSGICQNP